MKKQIRRAVTVVKNEGTLSLSIKTLQKLQQRQRATGSSSGKISFVSLVKYDDVLKADWSASKPQSKHKTKPPFTINWFMSPPSSGGGHQNIFRFIEYLDKIGHTNNVYLYSTTDHMTISQAKENVAAYCKAKKLKFFRYEGGKVADADVIFATGWETAYPVFNLATNARKMYFVQDFEPLFYSMGTNYVLAENTYKFGFHGITAGGWLAKKLTGDYGMNCDSYDFGAEASLYTHTNQDERKEIFFYARPVTERRGFDLGIMALQLFHEKHPEYVINLAGWDVSEYDVPFPYVNHKTLTLQDLPELYNRCAAALVLSLTNMSLLPLELLACGTVPVVNDGENNRLVSNNPYIAYTEASPSALADKLSEVVTKKQLPKYAVKASNSIERTGWQKSLEKVAAVLERELS